MPFVVREGGFKLFADVSQKSKVARGSGSHFREATAARAPVVLNVQDIECRSPVGVPASADISEGLEMLYARPRSRTDDPHPVSDAAKRSLISALELRKISMKALCSKSSVLSYGCRDGIYDEAETLSVRSSQVALKSFFAPNEKALRESAFSKVRAD